MMTFCPLLSSLRQVNDSLTPVVAWTASLKCARTTATFTSRGEERPIMTTAYCSYCTVASSADFTWRNRLIGSTDCRHLKQLATNLLVKV